MPKKPDDKKIGGVKSTTHTEKVKSTESVSEVSRVKATSGVGAVHGAGGIGKRRPTRVMTMAERAHIFSLIDEEAEKMLKNGAIPASKKDAVQKAVKMAVDSGLIEEDDKSKGK